MRTFLPFAATARFPATSSARQTRWAERRLSPQLRTIACKYEKADDWQHLAPLIAANIGNKREVPHAAPCLNGLFENAASLKTSNTDHRGLPIVLDPVIVAKGGALA